MWSSDWALFTPRSKFLVHNTRNCELPRWNNKGLHCQKEESTVKWIRSNMLASTTPDPSKSKLSSRLRFQVRIQHVWRRFQEEVIPLMKPRRNSASSSQTCTNTMSSWKRKDLSQTYSSSDSDHSWMVSFAVLDRAPFFEIIDSSFFVKFCKNVCFSFFTFNQILIFIGSNFDFPSFFRVNFSVHLSLWKFMLNFQGGENLVLTFLLSKIKIWSFHSCSSFFRVSS